MAVDDVRTLPAPRDLSLDRSKIAIRWGISDALITVASLMGVALCLVRSDLLPAKFDYDGMKIQMLARGTAAVDDGSFSGVASVYRALALANSPLVASLVGFSASLIVLAIARKATGGGGASKPMVAVFVMGIFLSSVYMATYSKELLVLPIAAVMLSMRGRRGSVLSVVLMAVYASQLRTYWWVVTALYCCFHFVLPRIRRPLQLLVIIVCSLAVLAAAYSIIRGEGLSQIRASINLTRIDSTDATTQIRQYVTGGSIAGETMNAVITMVFLVVPVPLILMGTPYHVLVGIVVGTMWIYVASRVVEAIRTGEVRRSPIVLRSCALLVAFAVTQALFEPDYGSALRHTVPLLGLVLCLTGVRVNGGLPSDRPAENERRHGSHGRSLGSRRPANRGGRSI